jgi:hypothetical protein
MAKFTFTSEEFAGAKTTVEFHAENMDKVLEHFKQFLQGSGFVMNANEFVEVVDRSWELGKIDYTSLQQESNFNGSHYTLDDSFPLDDGVIRWDNLDDIKITISEPEAVSEKKKKGKK